jgi:adenosylhomocysteine nucleosidase
VALIAALEREIRPLVRDWKASHKEYAGRKFRFFEGPDVVAVAGGIGFDPARRASEAVIQLFNPEQLISVGFAGALDPEWKAGRVFEPGRVVDARDGSSFAVGGGSDVLVSFGAVASAEQKRKLAAAYGAQAVDMEAGAVAKAAQAHQLPFRAVKVISDELDFELQGMERFIASDGKFLPVRFAASLAYQPWLWPRVIRLARNSGRAAESLCERLRVLGSSNDPRAQLGSSSRVGA